LWLFVVGPMLGAAIAVGLAKVLHPHRDPEEDEAAQGESA
jgi:hypothetical protein